MAGKTQKKSIDLKEQTVAAYMDYVLSEQKDPSSVYAFAKQLGVPESEFYKHFNHFGDIDRYLWEEASRQTIDSLKASSEFQGYSTREKLLGLFYTLTEVLNTRRSYYVYSLGKNKLPLKSPEGLKEPLMAFAREVIQEGLAGKEIEERKFISERYPDAVWMNALFILNFWSADSSRGFEKTDAAIEKSVNLMLELMGKSALDSMLDLGKFLFQNGIRTPFQK